VGAIVGGIVGGVVFLAIVGVVVFVVCTRRKKGRGPHTDIGQERAGALVKCLSLEDRPVSVPGSASAMGQGVPMMSAYGRGAGGDGEWKRGNVNGGAASPHGREEGHTDVPLEIRAQEILVSPAEIHGREVDEDGVSVQSFDIHGTSQGSSVPRLPLYVGGSAT